VAHGVAGMRNKSALASKADFPHFPQDRRKQISHATDYNK
jgi:hypothetical protein